MKNEQRRRRPFDDPVPPGDDVVPVPPPLAEGPIPTRNCDLVLTGGIASGVVYPWAILELAREYRFRNIGGTSVGAMAAALAAAAEYGRCTGGRVHFEVLRRAPAALGRVEHKGRTRMLSLFQPDEEGRRLMKLWAGFGRGAEAMDAPAPTSKLRQRWRSLRRWTIRKTRCIRALGFIAWIYWVPVAVSTLIGLLPAAWSVYQAKYLEHPHSTFQCSTLVLWFVVSLLLTPVATIVTMWRDVRKGILENDYGLCKGGTIKGDGNHGPGLSEWLHDSIQQAAGLQHDDSPLTFRDLWNAPDANGARRRPPCTAADPTSDRSIDLQMITTNVTFGRPMRLPLEDRTSRLFFCRKELEHYFPERVLDALEAASSPYAPQGGPGAEPCTGDKTAASLRELPVEDLPIVVAARLSLSFPFLFSAVPLWAIDFEAPRHARTMRRCLFTDGGVSSNFPIHLFDAAVPRWPTFGLWLDRRSPYRYPIEKRQVDQDVWLPEFVEQGRGDNWNRFDPDSRAVDPDPPPKDFQSFLRTPSEPPPKPGSCKAHRSMLAGFALALIESGKDWHDRTGFRMPHVRNRVIRLMLQPGEGALNIGMSRELILQMAHRYGTAAGLAFVKQFKDRNGQPSPAWNEQRWIRFNLLVDGLRERLDGLAASAARSGDSLPLRSAINRAVKNTPPGEPIRRRSNKRQISDADACALHAALNELERLEALLSGTSSAFKSPPHPQLRLRPPL